MLVRLLPEQVEKQWDWIGGLIERTLVPTILPTNETFFMILKAILEEKLVCWVYFKDDEPAAVVSTYESFDPIIGYSSLIIYSLNVFRQIGVGDITNAMETLRNYAEARKCPCVVAYSNHPHVIHAAERLGADASFKLLRWRI